jgi:hypothetical protein
MKNFFHSAIDWASSLSKDTGAIINIDANRSNLLRRLRSECQRDGFTVETVRQLAVAPAMEVAVHLGHHETSLMLERGGDDWQEIVFDATNHLQKCDEATMFVQLDAREARIYICCRQPADGQKRSRKVTLIDVVDSHNLADAYLQAKQPREE